MAVLSAGLGNAFEHDRIRTKVEMQKKVQRSLFADH